MKIAIIAFHFPPQWVAGSEIAAYKLAKYLTKKDHEVHVITRNSKTDENLKQTSNNQDKYDFNIHHLKITKNRYLEHLEYWIKSFFLLKKINPDIIHFQSMFIALPSSLMKFLLKKPIILSGRGSDIYHFPKSNFLKFFYKYNLKNADAVVVLTKHMQKAALKIYNREIYVIPNGIETQKFSGRARTKNIKNWKIIYVGGLRKVKGIKYLLKAMKMIISERTNTSLTIIGNGEEYYSLKKIATDLGIAESVEFLGHVDNDKIPKHLDSSDILVLPSLSEGFPNIILEALASGLPIICTDITGIREIILNGKNGFLVEPKSSQQITKKLFALIDDGNLYEEISRNNIIAAEKYELNSVLAQMEEIYIKLI